MRAGEREGEPGVEVRHRSWLPAAPVRPDSHGVPPCMAGGVVPPQAISIVRWASSSSIMNEEEGVTR